MGADTLTLIDGSSYVYRAFHALPHMSTSRGVPTNAVLGFTNMLRKALREEKPTHVVVAFDPRGPTFRQSIDAQYKANRPPPPDDLVPQFDWVRKIVAAMNVPVVEVPGYEADDVIATLTRRAQEKGDHVFIVTGDKDFMQLLTDGVVLYDSMRERRTTAADVPERLGVRADQVVDYLALVGDAIDNVPGLPGVGPKTAVDLLSRFGNIDSLLERINEVAKAKLRESIRDHRDQLLRARDLVRLRTDVPIQFDSDGYKVREPHDADLRALYTELEFVSLLRELPRPAAPTPTSGPVEVVLEEPSLRRLGQRLAEASSIAIRVLVDGVHPRIDPLVGLAVAWSGQRAYVPLGHRYLGAPRQLPQALVLDVLRPVLESPKPAKVGHQVKSDYLALRQSGVTLRGIAGDAALASYLLNPSRRDHSLADLARERLNCELPEDPASVRPTDRAAAPVEQSSMSGCAAAEAAAQLLDGMAPELKSGGLAKLEAEIELPLIPVLAEIERAGVVVDTGRLRELAGGVDQMLQKYADDVHRLAGHDFNINSSPQLAEVLFQELKLPVLRKGKTGPSADQDVLEKLAQQHPIAGAVLEYRSLAKLKGTYIDALPPLIEADGRIHTSFDQMVAATGRLSSSDPNLQNIPVRSELGKKIREAFVAPKGSVLLSADYSQIELRVLAHLSDDPALLDAFAHGEDVHQRTAAEVFGVAKEQVTSEMRRTAKAVNFGIAYGQSAFGLSQRLDLPTKEAQAIIDRYFARYAGVRTWLDRTIAQAKKDGAVTTLFGRRRLLPELKSRNFAARQGAERIAVNTPIQGTAADLIKLAMIRVAQRLADARLGARMVLQVHDELLFEVPASELEQVTPLVVGAMSEVGALKVPLVVDVGTGASWATAH
jgi:DNA polymerase I